MVEKTKEATALIVLEKDKQNYAAVLKLQIEISRARDYALVRTVNTLNEAKDATNDLTIMGNFKKDLEVLRQSYIKPRRAEIDDINAFFRLISDPLAEADKVTQDKVLAYKEKLEQIRLKAEEAARLQREADEAAHQVKEQTGEVVEKQAEEAVVVPPKVTSTVHAYLGTSAVIKNRKFEIENEELIPRRYMMPNRILIGKVIRAGGDIPGVRVFIEKGIRTTTRKED